MTCSGKNLHDMTVSELKRYAVELGLSSTTRLNKKEQLIAAIQKMMERRN